MGSSSPTAGDHVPDRGRRITRALDASRRGNPESGMRIDQKAAVHSSLAEAAEPGVAELCEALGEVVHPSPSAGPVQIERLEPPVYRLSVRTHRAPPAVLLKPPAPLP